MSAETREMDAGDLSRIEAIYVQHVGRAPPPSWVGTVGRALDDRSGTPLTWVAVDPESNEVIGYAVGEARPWEFGSEPTGWVIGLGIDERYRQRGVGRQLLARLEGAFRARSIATVRTMVRRTDVPLLSFFRRHGFVGGPFVQLELDLADAQNEAADEDHKERA